MKRNKLTKSQIAKVVLEDNELNKKDERELIDLLVNEPLSIDIDKKSDSKISLGDKVADKVSEVVGSWRFIIIFVSFLVCWAILNVWILSSDNAIDPYPFILLNLLLSCISAIQAPIIMMSQNRQAKKDTKRHQNDYRIDLKSELLLEELHKKIDKILKNQKALLKK